MAGKIEIFELNMNPQKKKKKIINFHGRKN